jgi:acyl-CoA synthetase (AMP-forming)/AMP-acid ligase II
MTETRSATGLLSDRVEHWAKTRPDDVAIKFEDRQWTWPQWRDRIHRLSGALLGAGIKRGDVVAFVDKNTPACLEVTLGASAIGAVDAVLNWRLTADELVYVLNDSTARIVFVGPESSAAVEGIRDKLCKLERVVIVGGDRDEYEGLLGAATPAGQQPDVSPDDSAFLIYTSGTTGFPKGAMITHKGAVAHSESVATAFRFEDGDHNLVAMPMFHVGGTSYALIAIHQGVQSTVLRSADVPSLVGAIASGVTHAFLVPAVIAGILNAGEQAIDALASLKWIGYGASPCPAPVLNAALAAWPDANFIQVYGATELAGVVTTLGPEAHRDQAHPERLASAGTRLPAVEMRVVSPTSGEDVEPGQPGELWLRATQVMSGYWGNPDATAESITADGWYRTGDIGQVDDGGFVFIVDRVKDMIISGGENIYSPEVEQVIQQHPAVEEVAIIGIPHPKWGEEVKAIVAPKPDQTVDADELIAFTRERLATYKCPRSVDVLPELPRSATGKILKKVLRKPYWKGQSRNV